MGAGLVIDAVGAPITRQQGVAALAPGGMLGLVGLGKGETVLDFLPVVGRELSIRGSYGYSDDDCQRALELSRTEQLHVRAMLVEAPLRDGVCSFERLVSNPAGLTKVVLRPD